MSAYMADTSVVALTTSIRSVTTSSAACPPVMNTFAEPTATPDAVAPSPTTATLEASEEVKFTRLVTCATPPRRTTPVTRRRQPEATPVQSGRVAPNKRRGASADEPDEAFESFA
eukprot:3532899-Pyramimonas_sp.AAC.1